MSAWFEANQGFALLIVFGGVVVANLILFSPLWVGEIIDRRRKRIAARMEAQEAAARREWWQQQVEDEQRLRRQRTEEAISDRVRHYNLSQSEAKSLAGMASLDYLLRLSPSDFEEQMAYHLRHQGYLNVRRIGGPNDLGVDIICNDPEGHRIAVQCKRYEPGRPISSSVIQMFYGNVLHGGYSTGIFITTSDYTKPAREVAQARGIELINGAALDWRVPRRWVDP